MRLSGRRASFRRGIGDFPVSPLVTGQPVLPREVFPALGTLVGLLSRVGHQVVQQFGPLREPPPALLALVGPLPRVRPPVPQQAGPPGEALPALVAFVRFLSGVHPVVQDQAFFPGEVPVAIRAVVRFIPGVDHPVAQQMRPLEEAPPALGTTERLLFGPGATPSLSPEAALPVFRTAVGFLSCTAPPRSETARFLGACPQVLSAC